MSSLRVVGAFAGLTVLILASSGVALGFSGVAFLAPAGGKSSGGCPSSNAVGNFLASGLVGAQFVASGSTWSLYFSSFYNLNSSNGVPGLIEYCVYPNGTLPSSSTAAAIGADGSAFQALSGTHQGYFSFGRANGDPSNLPLNGAQNTLMGTASWTSGQPTSAIILLHINDASECQALYGGGSNTCFVLPSPPPVVPCNGNPVCKTALVAEANASTPHMVPFNTQLHIRYTFTLSNPYWNNFSMAFEFPGAHGWNFTGVRDYSNCTQVPDPSGQPGALGNYSDYQGTGLRVILHTLNETGRCLNLVLTAVADGATFVLQPGKSISWTLDTVTGPNGFSGRGWHCINEGVTVVWIQSNDGLRHHYASPDLDVWTAS